MPLDPAKIAETKAWLVKAATDLRAAEHERTAIPPINTDIVFHAQQLVEKAIKGFLVWHDHPFRKTHNLVELGQHCLRYAPDLEEILREAGPLTEYAWRFRYPGDPDEPDNCEADEALSLARRVFFTILQTLPLEVRP
ncbi:HEPN domain-containing protein [Desulfobacca acetoxidans]|uniref:HEPN domain protein n=1 Tax=Desulfobacca acetoxidans (strain ATCC 700848 / DSM 11109 / ASRB2) TaxID=880072 RepID=F2NJ73_DESAR|nr:HEPN domain-containing protein [Desulfobacca acetoxidans]AEB09245.1 HEPN domain protein [Desulfobacca acetoxidans DSM 11109]